MPSILIAVGSVVLGVIAEAQQPTKVGRIGWLSIGSDSGPGSTIRAVPPELRALGYVEGKNIAFDYRYADNKLDRLPALADELVRLKVDVLVTPGTPAAIAAKNATKTIPIVFFRVSDPVPLGLVDSLSRPGGNVTGFTEISEVLAGKRLELLKETVPQVLPRSCAVESSKSRQCATMERKPTAGTRAGTPTSFHGGGSRRQVRGRVQRGS